MRSQHQKPRPSDANVTVVGKEMLRDQETSDETPSFMPTVSLKSNHLAMRRGGRKRRRKDIHKGECCQVTAILSLKMEGGPEDGTVLPGYQPWAWYPPKASRLKY